MTTRSLRLSGAALIALACLAAARTPAVAVDIKRAAPASAYMAMYARHNPERDYQRQYLADAFQTFKDERIGERIVDIITSRVPDERMAKAKGVWEQVQTALEPIKGQAILHADEFVFAEMMSGPANNWLMAAKMEPVDAEGYERGVTQLFQLVQGWSGDKVKVETSQVAGTNVTRLTLPKESPFQPAVARVDDLFLFSSNITLLEKSVEQLHSSSSPSKFDDPRLKEALTHLPKPEDSLMFLDGRQLFDSIRGVADFVRQQAPKDDEKAMRVAGVMEKIIDQVAILDYQVTVEYTDGGQNRTAEMGKLADGYDQKALGRALTKGQPFENWQKWVPKDATAYSLCTGVNLHELYDGITKLILEQVPESKQGFDKFAEVQEKVGVNIDKDVLQSFSGEMVSVTLPIEAKDGSKKSESVTAVKCANPDKIRELLGRAVEGLNKIPAVQAQQLKLVDCEGLDGFQEIQASIFPALGVKPVIGFREGWMMIACSRAAAEKVLDVRAGKAESIDSSASFAKFGLDPKGAVYSVGYSDIGAGVRGFADAIDKGAAMAPMFVGMVAAQAKPEDMKTIQDVIGLLPSVSKVIRKLDFFEHKLSVARKGPLPNTYIRESVTEVRQPTKG